MGGSYRRYSKEHDDQLFLVQDWMPNKSVGKSGKASSTLLDECCVGCKVITVDCETLASINPT